MEAEPGCVEYPVEQRWTRATSMARRPKVELLARGTEEETGDRQTWAMKTGKPEGRRSPVELKVWRFEVQPVTQMSMPKAELQLTEADSEGRGSMEES